MKMKKNAIAAAVVLALGLPLPGVVAAQQPTNEDLKKQLDALSESVKAMQTDLQEIKRLLSTRPPAAPSAVNVVLDIADNRPKGSAAAPLTLVEFTDYQCGFCSRHVRDTFPKLDEEYIKTGRIRYVVMDVPLESIHKLAFKAAESANCAAEQGKYWEMHDRLFANAKALEPFSGHAGAIGLDVPAFDACLASGRYAAEVRRDMAEARKLGITGTPGFVIARSENRSGTLVRTVAQIKGAQPFDTFKAELDRHLAAASKAPASK
jgi:protein-disulfide isomerase